MLSRLSQIGKNITEEINSPRKSTSTSDEHSIDGSKEEDPTEDNETGSSSGGGEAQHLPLEIQAKLRKFDKYEQKYPSLLEAYKNEKARNAQVVQFEKILQENTPCSSIGEGEQLAEFLHSLNAKNTMLSDELRRVTKEANEKHDKEVTSLQDEITKLKVQLENGKQETNKGEGAKESEESNDELVEELNSAKIKIESLDSELGILKTERDDLKDKVVSLETRLESTQGLFDELSRGTEKTKVEHKNEVDSLSKELSELKKQHPLETEEQGVSDKVRSLEEDISIKQKKIDELEDQVNSLQESTAPVAVEETANPIPSSQADTSTSAKKNKKKKKKGKNGNSNAIFNSDQPTKDSEQIQPEEPIKDPQQEDALTDLNGIKIQHSKLQKDFDELTASHVELQTAQSTALKVKDEEISNLRDMLRDVGDDLVTAREELKELKSTSSSAETILGLEKTIKDQKLELDILRSQHSDAVTEYEKDKNEKSKLSAALQENKKELDNKISSLTNELEIIKKKLVTVTQSEAKLAEAFRAKNSEINELRVHTNDLENSLKEAREESQKQSNEIKSINRAKSTLEKELDNMKLSNDTFTKEKQKLEQELLEFQKLKKNEANLTKELYAVQTNLNHREKTITYFEKQVKDYEVLKTQLLEEVAKLKGFNRELNIKTNSLNDQASRISREKAKLSEEVSELTKKYNASVDEAKRLHDEKEILQNKYEGLQDLKSTSNEEVETIKKQCEELSLLYKEARNRADDLEQELSESRTMLQERTREAGTIRRLLIDKEQDQDSKVDELKSKLKSVMEEKDRIQSDSSMTLAKKQREYDDIRLKNQELEKVVDEWQSKKNDLLREIAELKEAKGKLDKEKRSSSTNSDELSSIIDKLKDSLNTSEKKVREYENLNNVLKKLNEELSSKIDRLSKNFKTVSNQLKDQKQKSSNSASPMASPVSTRSNSIVSNMNTLDTVSATAVQHSNDNGDGNMEKIAYIKNVLLGFLEHKEQRQQLLPVISMLLQLNRADEKRFLLALK